MIEIHLRHGEASPVTGSLTEAGETQANVAASYIKAHFPRALRIGIHSGSRRAVETAQLLELPRTAWTKDERLREADWKGIPEPREFEPWAEMYDRVASSLKDWDARNADDDRIFVTHGGTLRMVRAYREGFIRSSFPLLFDEPYKYFTNGQLIIYTDEDPAGKPTDPGTLWVKSVSPQNPGRFGHDWMPVANKH